MGVAGEGHMTATQADRICTANNRTWNSMLEAQRDARAQREAAEAAHTRAQAAEAEAAAARARAHVAER
jgi:hypothetical protein